jgi:hypothetical protein
MLSQNDLQYVLAKKPFKKSVTFNHTTFDGIVIPAVSETGTSEYCYDFTLNSNSLPLISTSCVHTSHNSKIFFDSLGPEDKCSKLLQSAGNYLPIEKVS